MPSNDPHTILPLKLHRRYQLLNSRYNKAFFGFLGLCLLVIFLSLWLAQGANPAAVRAMLGMLAGSYAFWLLLGITAIFGVLAWCSAHYECLIISETGLVYRTLFRGPLAFLYRLKPNWRVDWQDIARAEVKMGGLLHQYSSARRRRIVLHTRLGETRRLDPYFWYTKPDRAGMTLGEFLRMDDEKYVAIIRQTPLVRVMMDRELFEPGAGPGSETAGGVLENLPGGSFDLAKSPGALAVLVGFTLLGAYAVADAFFLSPWRYTGEVPVLPFIAAAVVALLIASVVMRSVPKLERRAMSFLFVVAAAGAVYPALPRINAATDRDGVMAYRYRQVDVGHFVAVDNPDLPELSFDRGMEYWEHLSNGTERAFYLARGTLDFWQLNLSRVRADQRLYYRTRDERSD